MSWRFRELSSYRAKYCGERVCMSVCSLAYLNKSSGVAPMGDRLATIDMDRKVGAAVPLSVGSWVPI